MGTGVVPFRGESSPVIFKAILDETSVSPVRLNPDLPADFERIIGKALEKDRNLRYQSAADLRTDLTRLKRDLDSGRSPGVSSAFNVAPSSVATAAAPGSSQSTSAVHPSSRSNWYLWGGIAALVLIVVGVGAYVMRARSDSGKISSIAVLPFVNATADPANDYLSDGLTESLISSLSQVRDVKVMARSTVFRFKGNQEDPRQIGDSLKVAAVLVGRIAQHGDELSVQADLVSTSDGSELWGSHYVRKLTEIMQIQSDLSQDLSGRLRSQANASEPTKLGKAGTSNPEAYRLYLEGRQQWYGRTSEGLKKSIDLFHQAIAADPNYALAYTGLADTYNVGSSYGIGLKSRQTHLLADEATRKALELDPTLSEAHTARASALAMSWRWSEAEPEYHRALELNPNNANAHYFYGVSYLLPENRIDQALEEFRKALSLDPLSPIINANYATTLMAAHRYPEALAQFQKTLQADPNFPPGHYKLAQYYSATGNFAEAAKEMQKFSFVKGSFSPDAKGYAESVVAHASSDEWFAPIAAAYAAGGNKEKAFEYLEKAYAVQDTELLLLIRYPMFDVLRTDPRYADLMRRVGLPP
jgi:TolB-like protein/Tfp pilus assembly protein PilF